MGMIALYELLRPWNPLECHRILITAQMGMKSCGRKYQTLPITPRTELPVRDDDAKYNP